MTNSNDVVWDQQDHGDTVWHAGGPVEGLKAAGEPIGDPFVVDQFTLALEKQAAEPEYEPVGTEPVVGDRVAICGDPKDIRTVVRFQKGGTEIVYNSGWDGMDVFLGGDYGTRIIKRQPAIPTKSDNKVDSESPTVSDSGSKSDNIGVKAVYFDPLDDAFGRKLMEDTYNALEKATKAPEPAKKPLSLLELAQERIGERSSGYGKENSFGAIRRLWNAYLGNKVAAGDDSELTDFEVADMMVLFKLARKQVRRFGGKPYKQDDNIDAAGYVAWADKLESGKGE